MPPLSIQRKCTQEAIGGNTSNQTDSYFYQFSLVIKPNIKFKRNGFFASHCKRDVRVNISIKTSIVLQMSSFQHSNFHTSVSHLGLASCATSALINAATLIHIFAQPGAGRVAAAYRSGVRPSSITLVFTISHCK